MAGPKPGGGPRGTGSGPACGIALPLPLWQGQRRGVKDWFRTERKSKKKMKRKPKLAGRAIGPGKRGRTGCGGPALVFRKTGTYTRAELLLRTLSGMSPAEGLAAPAGRQHATANPHARGPSRGSWGPERGRRARQVRGTARCWTGTCFSAPLAADINERRGRGAPLGYGGWAGVSGNEKINVGR